MPPSANSSRRRFLQGAFAAGAAGGTGGAADAPSLKRLREQLKGDLILPSGAAYEAATRIFFWNPGTERRPAAVVRCAHADDVRRAVEFARRHDLELAVRGGGHSPLGWGLSNGLVIDVTGMKTVTVDAARRTARFAAGVSSGEAMRAAGRYGLAPVLGQCPGVGAAGVTLGGGLGWLSGLHGAACDNLISARLVTADGRLLEADADRHPDLLWALRGAGANFGVTTSFLCRLHPIGPVTSGDIHYPAREAGTVLRFFRRFMAEAPDAFQATLNLTPGERGVFISLCHAGDAAEAERLLKALRSAARVTKDTVRRQEFQELAARTPVAAADVRFRCLSTVYREDFTDELILKLLDRLAEAPPETVIGVSHYMHGELCRVRPEAAAFPLRKAGAVHIRVGIDWNDPAASEKFLAWTAQARGRLRPASAERVYANYQSHADTQTPMAVFGGNHGRLAALKRKYDPSNLFRRNSNVAPA
jgi:FAD/FMN-containing dehydrogenase